MTNPSYYPLFARLEYFLSRSRLIALSIDYLIHRPRRWWQIMLGQMRNSPESLYHFEAKVFSQNGEDGIIAEIFRRIGVENKYAVEFGIEDGTECCTRNLFLNHGWQGLLIEGSQEAAAKAKALYANLPLVNVNCSFITRENILDIFNDFNVPKFLDLLVIDIDGNDYWICQKVLSIYKPRVLVIEYNGKWVPPTEWIMPYDPQHCWDGSAYFGASLTSLTKLAESHNYSLVGCNLLGNNSFFVRNNIVGNYFPHCDRGAGYHYVPPNYGSGFGFPFRSRSRWHLSQSKQGKLGDGSACS